MSYNGEDVRKLAEQYRAELAQCDKIRWEMVQDFLERIRAQDKKREQK